MNVYVPATPRLRRIWKQLSEAIRGERIEVALRRERTVKAVAARPEGESERVAIKRLAKADRSTFRRWQERYSELGLDGLIDSRLPPPRRTMPPAIRDVICTLRRSDPQCDVSVIIAHLAKHHGFAVGGTKVKDVLREAGLARRGGPVAGNPETGEVRLELAGMKLVEAACVKTGYVTALTNAVVAVAKAAPVPPGVAAADTSGRDESGRFLSEHNERNRKSEGQDIGPAFASVEVARATKDPGRYHLNHVGPEIIERKIWGLMASPLLGGGRWDGIRVARGDLLGELCGYPYMPSTLDLFTRELKFLGIANTWWETHARLWHVQTRAWGDPRFAAVLYVDESNKPVWTDLFSHASKVSQTGRVMPSMEVVAFHSGYGVPLWQVTHSGRAPLVREVPPLLARLQGILGGAEVGRIVVIDAEGNSIPFLKGLETGTPSRGWITRLRPGWVESKTIIHRTSYRAYRNGDRIRMGEADFVDPDERKTFRMRVIEIERRSSGQITYLGASRTLSDREWSAPDLADLYFDRWPNQEADFRAVNQAVRSKEVHGYGKQLVDNVTVITELDKLSAELVTLARSTLKQKADHAALTTKIRVAQVEAGRRERRLATVTRVIDSTIAKAARITPRIQRLSEERVALQKETTRSAASLARKEARLLQLAQRRQATERRAEDRRARREILETRRHIFRHDVELDSIFGLLKVGLVLLVTYVLKELLANARMEPVTFLERLATLPGRLRQTPALEIVTFDYNHRDPDIMELLSANAAPINALRLPMRSGRVLRIAVDPAPPPSRPPPAGPRTKTKRRFAG